MIFWGIDIIPSYGYRLPKWNMGGQYRATAYAYMMRENVSEVEHYNGNWYSLETIKNAMIYENNTK